MIYITEKLPQNAFERKKNVYLAEYKERLLEKGQFAERKRESVKSFLEVKHWRIGFLSISEDDSITASIIKIKSNVICWLICMVNWNIEVVLLIYENNRGYK